MAAKRISFRVEGKVQGVCFRQFTIEQAKSLDITGHVLNASDGSVQGEAQGGEDALKEFVQHLNQGPSHARVTGVEQSDISTKPGESGFHQK